MDWKNHFDIQDLLDEIFYKPGYEFGAFPMAEGSFPALRVRILAHVIDSTTFPIDPSRVIPIITDVYLPPYIEDKDTFYKWLLNQIIHFEVHEAKEWLRSFDDGKPLYDPHEFDRRA